MSRRDGPGPTLLFRNPHLLGVVIVVLLVAGWSALSSLPRIEDPRITTRNALIITTLPGAPAARVEALVTEKLENRLEEVPEIKEIESTSRRGISLISIELEDATDASNNEEAFSKVRDKLADAEPELPADASKPVFDDKRGAVAFSLIAAVRWSDEAPAPLGVLTRAGETLADRLRNISGTEIVRLYGEAEEEISVTVEPAELAALGLSVADLSRALERADSKSSAGVFRGPDSDLLIEVRGKLDSTQRVGSVPLSTSETGEVLRIADLAQVKKDWRDPPASVALAAGERAVYVAARVEDDIRVDRWGSAAKAVVDVFASESGGPVSVDIVFDQSRYTAARLSELSVNLLGGALVVVAVVLLAMGWRAALIVGAALPLSAAATLFGLTFFDQQIHQMTIFGMIIAIGLLIDNAIVVTDEVQKHLRAGLSRADAVSHAVRHLTSPLVASTLTTVLGFMPIFLLPGNVGDFVGPIAISVVLALLASLAISLTVIATLAGRFVSTPGAALEDAWWRSGWSNATVARCYRRALGFFFRRPVGAMGLALLLPVAGFIAVTRLGVQFFPPAERDQFEVEFRLSNDASIDRTTRLARDLSAAIEEKPGVERVDWLIGASFPTVYYNLVMNIDNNPSYAHAIVTAASTQRAEVLIADLQDELNQRFPEAQTLVSAFGQGPPSEAPVAFRIAGEDVRSLDEQGESLRRVMQETPGILHTRASIQTGLPKLDLVLNEDEVNSVGLTLRELADRLEANLEGRRGGSVLEDLEELPVRIRYRPVARNDIARVATLGLSAPSAASGERWVPLSALGELRLVPELASITRRNGERVNNVYGYIRHGLLPIEIAADVQSRLDAAGFEIAPGYRLEVGGTSEDQGRAVGQLSTYVPVLLALMVATLILTFRSVSLAGIISAVALLSLGLGMLSLRIAGFDLGFNPMIGSAGLIGVAINGSIVVLAAIRTNARARLGDPDAVADETLVATRHVVSTTLTTMGGFVPLVVLTGGNFWPPLAVVIAGGVGFSITLSLLFTPAAYQWMAKRKSRRAARAVVHSQLQLSESPV